MIIRNFWVRYYLHLFALKFGSVKFVLPTLLFVILTVGTMEIFGVKLLYVQWGIAAAIIAYIAFMLLLPLIYTLKYGRVAAVLDKYGYSEEYLKAYEKAMILNKPFDLTRSAQFAEIYLYIGQSEKAVEYLGSLTLPNKPRRFEMVEYLRVYVLALLKCGEQKKAEELWAKNSYYIHRMKTIENYSRNVGFIFLTEIYIECCGALNGDENRLQRAYELTSSYMKSDKCKGGNYLDGFDIIMTYELKALGKDEEFTVFYPSALRKIDIYSPIFDFARELELKELEKAADGIFPFLD